MIASAKSRVVFVPLLCGAVVCFGTVRSQDHVEKPNEIVGNMPEGLLQKAGIGTDTKSLIAYLDSFAGKDEDLIRLPQWIMRLESDSFEQREEASRKLVGLGPAALAALRPLRRAKDIELSRRANDCVAKIDAAHSLRNQAAAIELLRRRTDSAVLAALVQFAPYAPDEETQDEVWFGAYDIVKANPKLCGQLIEHVKDKLPTRRGLAGCLVGRLGNPAERESMRPLLRDPDPTVRLRAAQGLFAAGDTSSIDLLISLLEEKSVALAWQAEELLIWAAGAATPKCIVGSGGERVQSECRAAWQEWWEAKKSKFALDLPEHTFSRPGLILVTETTGREKQVSRTVLSGCNGRPRCEYGPFIAPCDVRFVNGERLLVAHIQEDGTSLLTEHHFDGTFRWSTRLPAPAVACGPLSYGNVFLLSRTRLFEVAPDGSIIGNHARPPELSVELQPARLSRHGFVSAISRRETSRHEEIVTIDVKRGKECGRVPLTRTVANEKERSSFYSIEELPPGGYLIADRDAQTVTTDSMGHIIAAGQRGRLMTTNAQGQVTWEMVLPTPGSATRLPNNEILLICGTAGQTKVLEVGQKRNILRELFIRGRASPCFNLTRLGFDRTTDSDLDLATCAAYRLRGLDATDPDIRRLMAFEARYLGAKAVDVFPALINLMKDGDDVIRNTVQDTLAVLAPELEAPLLGTLKDNSPVLRGCTAYIIGQARLQADTNGQRYMASNIAVPALIRALDDTEPLVRQQAAYALGQYGRQDARSVNALVKALQDTDGRVAGSAAASLGRIGERADSAVPILLNLLHSADTRLQHSVLFALGNIRTRPDPSIPEIARILNDAKRTPELRESAMRALQRYGALRKDAVISALRSVVDDENARLRTEAAAAIKALEH